MQLSIYLLYTLCMRFYPKKSVTFHSEGWWQKSQRVQIMWESANYTFSSYARVKLGK